MWCCCSACINMSRKLKKLKIVSPAFCSPVFVLFFIPPDHLIRPFRLDLSQFCRLPSLLLPDGDGHFFFVQFRLFRPPGVQFSVLPQHHEWDPSGLQGGCLPFSAGAEWKSSPGCGDGGGGRWKAELVSTLNNVSPSGGGFHCLNKQELLSSICSHSHLWSRPLDTDVSSHSVCSPQQRWWSLMIFKTNSKH